LADVLDETKVWERGQLDDTYSIFAAYDSGYMEVASPLERFERNPAQIRREIRVELGFNGFLRCKASKVTASA